MSTRRRLSHLLLASHMGLILLFALLLLATGVGTVRSAVMGQARTEAERTLGEARQRLQDWHRELTVAADLLAEQPTLGFYLGRGQRTKARDLLADFHATSNVDYLRVQWEGRTIVEKGPTPPAFDAGLAFDANGTPWRIVRRGIQGEPRAAIVVGGRLGARLALPAEEAAVVRLQPPISGPGTGDAWKDVLKRVGETGEPLTVEDIGPTAAARIVSLRGSDGTAQALLSARVGKDWVQRRTLEWFAAFGGALLATCALALGLAGLLASRIARPFAQLAAETGRLGAGDLDTPVTCPDTFLAEPVALAVSLEEMRAQVASLTTTERRQREELDAILNGVDEGIVRIDDDGGIRYANRQFLELIGRAHDDVLGERLDDLLFPVASPQRAEDEASGLTPFERYTPAGALRPLTVRRLRDSGQRPVLVVREENAIEAARAMRDRILANLSHEFQTPLSAQIASIELLRDHLRAGSDRVALRLADAQFRGTMRLSQLVENLLDSVRIESGEMRLRRQPVDVAEVANEAIELMQPLIDQRDQRIVASIQPGRLITGDGPRLLSVVVNLLANANKFAPDQTTIWVGTEWQPESVTLWVEDEGPGLPPAHSVRDLFAPFRRAPEEEPSQRGTGLGLAIVHAVVAAHRGQVRIDAPVHRNGTRIGVVLPLGENR